MAPICRACALPKYGGGDEGVRRRRRALHGSRGRREVTGPDGGHPPRSTGRSSALPEVAATERIGCYRDEVTGHQVGHPVPVFEAALDDQAGMAAGGLVAQAPDFG